MAAVVRRAKAKAAQRVIEVLDFFDEQHRHASVMDIARRYNRPQSSTSELLATLVELGMLYKDAASRSYTLTPRAAILGSLSQPRQVRDGSLSLLIDELREQTGLGVVLIGMVGANAQLFQWKPGRQQRDWAAAGCLAGGMQERLCDTVAGWLLLSTLPPRRREGLIRRLNAEAADDCKFNPTTVAAHVQAFELQGFAIGTTGFGTTASLAAILLPTEADDRPMSLGIVHHASDAADPLELVALLRRSVPRLAAAPQLPAAFAPAGAQVAIAA